MWLKSTHIGLLNKLEHKVLDVADVHLVVELDDVPTRIHRNIWPVEKRINRGDQLLSVTKRLTVSARCRVLLPLGAANGGSGGSRAIVEEDTTVDMTLCLGLVSVLSHDLLKCDLQVKYLLRECVREEDGEREGRETKMSTCKKAESNSIIVSRNF